MKALCLDCRAVAQAEYDVRSDGVYLVRHCDDCPSTEAMILRDVPLFEQIRDTASRAGIGPRGLIAELLDGCNIECPTCIAESGILSGNVRDARELTRSISRAMDTDDFAAVLLSGGEPTIHPKFFRIAEFAAGLSAPSRVLITNGLRFAREPEFTRKFAEVAESNLELFLQFDSLRPENLLDLRGADYSRDRINSVTMLNEVGVAVTLVNVVKRSVTLDHISEVLDFARQHSNVVGVQFQPIRDAGRVDNFRWIDNSCDVSDVFDRLPGGVRLSPCTSSPWSSFIGNMSRSTGSMTASTDPSFYISKTNSTAPDDIRIAVLDYSDRYNWTDDRSRLCSLSMLNSDGSTSAVDDYFLGL